MNPPTVGCTLAYSRQVPADPADLADPAVPAHLADLDRGLDDDGRVRREGDPGRIQPAFAGLVDDLLARSRETFGEDLDSVYLYGSVPRGTARPGVSDLDGQLLLAREVTQADRAAVLELEQELGAAHPEVAFVGILLDSRKALTDPADRWDGGFHVRVLCTPVWGPDAGEDVEPHPVCVELALGVQGDWRGALDRLRTKDAGVDDPAQVAELCGSAGRRLARIAFAWVMPRWGGWTSDPAVMQRVVDALEPGWSAPMADAVRLGWGGVQDLPLARSLLAGWAVELTERGRALEG